MAHTVSARKRIRQAAKRRLQNRYYAKTMRNAIRDLRAMENKKDAEKRLPEVISMVDRMVKRNQMHQNRAARLKSRLTKHINAM